MLFFIKNMYQQIADNEGVNRARYSFQQGMKEVLKGKVFKKKICQVMQKDQRKQK